MPAAFFIGISLIKSRNNLTACGLKVGLIKHSHHNIETDKPGKDSYRLRQAGANPTMVVCDQRWALMCETPAEQAVDFQQFIAKFDCRDKRSTC